MGIKQRSIPKTKNILVFLLKLFYLFAATIHLLVILKVIPYYWINGGQSNNLSEQTIQSSISIIFLATLAFIVSRDIFLKNSVKKWQLYFLKGLCVFWFTGLVLQIIGTNFEKYIVSWLLLFGFVVHLLFLNQIKKSINSGPTLIK